MLVLERGEGASRGGDHHGVAQLDDEHGVEVVARDAGDALAVERGRQHPERVGPRGAQLHALALRHIGDAHHAHHCPPARAEGEEARGRRSSRAPGIARPRLDR